MLLIVTNKTDVHADAVIRKCQERSVQVFRLNTEDLLSKYRVSLLVNSLGGWTGSITDALNRSVPLNELRVAWIRRPEFLADDLSDGVQNYIASEVKALVSCLYALPCITFVNDVFHANRARTKFQQLALASQFGVRIPRTIITNDPAEVRQFVALAAGDLLVKSVFTGNVERGGFEQALPSKRLSRERLSELCELVKHAPTQIQDYVEKRYELRVTVVGNQVFPVKIESQIHDETRVDWRRQISLCPHSLTEIPDSIREFCIRFLHSQALLYGAMDFILDPEGNYVFLENNPSGQYLWLEHATGIRITDALVDLFVSLMTPKGHQDRRSEGAQVAPCDSDAGADIFT